MKQKEAMIPVEQVKAQAARALSKRALHIANYTGLSVAFIAKIEAHKFGQMLKRRVAGGR